MSFNPIQNAEPWKAALQRFTSARYAFFREWAGFVLPTVQLGKDFPDRERVQFNVSGDSAVQGNATFPACGISSQVDIRIEAVSFWFSGAPAVVDRNPYFPSPFRCGLAFATTTWNPFGATALVYSPQFRPSVTGGRFLPGATVGIVGTGPQVPLLSLGHATFPEFRRSFGTPNGNTATITRIDLGQDGVIVPARSILALVPESGLAAPVWNNLWTSFTYRELG